MLSLDFETTGLDLRHGARPFAVVWCDESGPQCREWDVDPLTRKVTPNPADVDLIRRLVADADRVVFHNAKFDCRCLELLGIEPPWGKFEDTLVASHVLHSHPPHNLTAVVKDYLDQDLSPYEDALEEAVKHCRSLARHARNEAPVLTTSTGRPKKNPPPDRRLFYGWKIARDEDPDLPSNRGEEPWHSDYWLPRTAHRLHPDSVDPSCATVLRDYALVDAVATYRLWQHLKTLLRDRGYWKVYRARLLSVPAAFRMERRGMTLRQEVVESKTSEYKVESQYLRDTLLGVARQLNYPLVLPNGTGTKNHSLDDFLFGRAPRVPREGKSALRDGKAERLHAPDTLNLPVVKVTESDNPSFDFDAREIWLAQLPVGTLPRLFVETLHTLADFDKALGALADYDRYKVSVENINGTGARRLSIGTDSDCKEASTRTYSRNEDGGLQSGANGSQHLPTGITRPCNSTSESGKSYRIHPSFNVTGTTTTRWSSSNPNAQNVSKQSAANLRECFGPAPGRVWYSMDAANIELRIPAYLADERELIEVFERPDEPPYYGSYHLLIFAVLHPELFAKHGKDVKPLFEDSWYQWVKNGNFARQYGAQEQKVDATYRVPGAYRKIADRFPRIDKLNKETIARANATGCVVALPDRSVDSDRGYRIVCRRNEYDRIPPTVPFAYFVSGTAGVWMNGAVRKCDALMEQWRREEGYDGHLIATVHDEIVFDLPDQGVERERPRVTRLKETMESCGTDIGIPVPVSVERHVESWAVGESIK